MSVIEIFWDKDFAVRNTVKNGQACVASISVRFKSKERPRNRILGFGRARNETRAKK